MTRIAIVDKEKCKPTKCANLCGKVCPVNKTGKGCITYPEFKAEIDEVLCTGCGICVKRCPFDAITIINLPEQLNQDPIHRYGKNGFSLYSLPTPVPGKIVGIVGRNGIGKSTAFKIIAGTMNPNFGEVDSIYAKQNQSTGIDYDRLISYFKGTESQGFFEHLRDGTITVSYKPQSVDLIPRHFSGTVKDLLEQVGAEPERFERITTELEVKDILDRDIKSVSGGELQRVAIAATILKKADLYIFDEPTSYLDIKQRLHISRVIRSLVDDKTTSVLLIEHDLIILDYIADLVHLMYGREGAYGIVSQPKATKTGINIFLSGMLREENIRFRDYSIVFSERPALQAREGRELVSWKSLTKSYEGFKLDIEPAKIHSKNIIGVLGANGIGKTTFARLLAGEIKPDSEGIEKKLKISYKPQYINMGSDETVYSVVSRAIERYENVLIKPLGIQHLYEKTLSQLSGGELQRVSIVAALAQDADLYLLDEPSAYLDVEQRILLSKIIAEFIEYNEKTAVIIDHDLLFIDYLSQRIMIFDGVPSKHGHMRGIRTMEEGMNEFLQDLGITFRRDHESYRPRANKTDSQMDRKQKSEKRYYYTS